jgi:DNA-binding HxlR family transcriptional regulator
MSDGSQLCPRYHHAVELLGRRWAGAIVCILLGGPARYNELRAAIPDINDRMLAERLRELEAENLVVRTVLPEAPVRVEYALTEKGRALETAIAAIGRWAERWIPAPAAQPQAPKAASPSRPARGVRRTSVAARPKSRATHR